MASQLTWWDMNIAGCGGNAPNRMRSCISLLVITLLAVAACTAQEPTNPNFPQLHGGPVGLEALLTGELVSENGCLRVRSVRGTDYLLIWPNMSEMTADGQGVRLSSNSDVTLSVGDRIRMSGGVAARSHVQNIVMQPIPSECTGPYWLVGRGISVYSE